MANLSIQVQDGNNINVEVVPTPQQKIEINRGLIGPAGPNAIGGFPIAIASPTNYDALMFLSNQWVNENQLEISDGGNF